MSNFRPTIWSKAAKETAAQPIASVKVGGGYLQIEFLHEVFKVDGIEMKVRAAGKFSVKMRGVGGGLGGRSDAFKVTL